MAEGVCGQSDRQTDRQTGRQAGRQAGRQIRHLLAERFVCHLEFL